VFYRRKIILALLQLFDGQLGKIRLQKLLFLFTIRQAKPDYDFIPYKYGCCSFSANADLTTMVRKGLLEESEKDFIKLDKKNYLKLPLPWLVFAQGNGMDSPTNIRPPRLAFFTDRRIVHFFV